MGLREGPFRPQSGRSGGAAPGKPDQNRQMAAVGP